MGGNLAAGNLEGDNLLSPLDGNRDLGTRWAFHTADHTVLLEIHEERDLDYICDGVTVIGVNNRDLKIFKSDIQTSLRLVGRIPDEYIKISESGLKTTSDLRLLRKAGFQGFLMGEHFMKHPQPAKALEKLIQEL